MGLIAKLVSFGRTVKNSIYYADVKCAPGNGANVIAHNFSAAGDDSKPLTSDNVLLVKLPQTGRFAVAGYSDPSNAGETSAGEKRIYARDSDGAVIGYVWLKTGGSILIANDAGSFEMQSGGDVVINGVTITVDGDVVSATGVSLDNHPHAQGNDAAGNVEVATEAPTATEI